MVIIDAQIHVWSPDVSTRPWRPGSTPRSQGAACSAEQVLRVMDDAGVARTVLVPPSWVGDDNTDALDAARRWPDRFGVRSEEHTSELQSRPHLVCRLLLA